LKKLSVTFILLFLFVVGIVPLSANMYEVGFKVMDRYNSNVAIDVTVEKRIGGDLVGTLTTDDCTSCDNFVIDLNGQTPPSHGIQLQVGVQYVITFHYPGGDKSFCYSRSSLDCGGGVYDTFYNVTPTSLARRSGTAYCEVEDLTLYPDCTVIYPLSLTLSIIDEDYIGDKIISTLRATATGGNQSYSFSWSGAYAQTSSTTNPNIAKRTILQSQTVTVSCTVTSNGQSVTKTKTLSGEYRP
jgi:hypothetical protein